jgi:L-ascorbate metabolism protein UlaG (beta-lactamase superfamily)
LKYFGHACWLLQHGNTNVVIDPFLSESPWLNGGIPRDLEPDLVLLTHGHFDHLGDTIEIAKRRRAPVLAMVELADFLNEQGVKSIDGNFGGVIKFDFGWAKFVPAWHSSTWMLPNQAQRSSIPCGFVIRFFDQTIYHAGDTCLFYDMKLIGEVTPIDVALLPIGGHYTMGVDDAVKAVELLAPKVVVPMHYNTWAPIEQDPEDFKRKVEERTAAQCNIVKPGTEWEIPAQL